MKQFVISLVAVGLLGGAAAYSFSARDAGKPAEATNPAATAHFQVESGKQNPWTNLEFNNRAENFQFAIVSDRTGGHRPGVFPKAIEKINLLQPEFVISVGDLIEGYTEDPGQWALEWSEFQSKLDKLEMPFFYCGGNHDLTNDAMTRNWVRKFGKTYYHFVYRDVLFLVLNSEDPGPRSRRDPQFRFSKEQQDWAVKVLRDNAKARWTFVFLHKPTWTYPNEDLKELGWETIENALQENNRKYTVFAGHKHNYAKVLRKGREYYMLATTGGGSSLKGVKDGTFDHFVWVTMRNEAPRVANVLLDGVEPSDLRVFPDIKTSPAKKTTSTK